LKVFDIESDGLLHGQADDDAVISKLHCINGIDTDTGREYRFTDHEFYQLLDGYYSKVPTPRDGTIAEGLAWLTGETGGHNIIGYDIPAIEQLYPEWEAPTERRFDSAVVGKCIYPNLKDKDWSNKRKGKLPNDFYAGGNKLMHWALRAGKRLKAEFNPKDYGHTWKTMPFTQEMDDYCMDDVRANVDVIEMQMSASTYVEEACNLELEVAEIIKWQERVGVRFDVAAGEKLAKELYIKLHQLEQKARESFGPFYMKGKEFTPKRDNKSMGYIAGAKVTKLKLTEFNPGSRQQIANRLTWKYDWAPTEFTEKGQVKIDEEVLGALPFEEARTFAEYFTVAKRLSQLAEGKQAWLKAVKKDGRIYGRVDQLGTGTGRMSHFGPNLAQVPKTGKPYGAECRGLFIADDGRDIVGCDADALELRILAHFLARFDRGAYVTTVLDGNKTDGTDMHTRNQTAIGLIKRDTAKTWFYACLYGSGDFNLGTIVMSEWDEAKLLKFYKAFPPGQKRRSKITALGRRSRARLMSAWAGFERLLEAVHKSAERGHLRGLDKRQVPVRSKHSALNFLCQGAGALVMKKALVIMFAEFKRLGLQVLPLLNVHDEVQLSTKPEESKNVGRIAAQSIAEAGEYFGLRCPLAGDYDIGQSWAETH
jgi:DNA polymerase I-like protein with 3'-5' exonuclease and polymerase domains